MSGFCPTRRRENKGWEDLSVKSGWVKRNWRFEESLDGGMKGGLEQNNDFPRSEMLPLMFLRIGPSWARFSLLFRVIAKEFFQWSLVSVFCFGAKGQIPIPAPKLRRILCFPPKWRPSCFPRARACFANDRRNFKEQGFCCSLKRRYSSHQSAVVGITSPVDFHRSAGWKTSYAFDCN